MRIILEQLYKTHISLSWSETNFTLLKFILLLTNIFPQIESDFESLYPDKKSVLYNEWSKFAAQIMEEAAKRGKIDKNIEADLRALFSTTDGKLLSYNAIHRPITYFFI